MEMSNFDPIWPFDKSKWDIEEHEIPFVCTNYMSKLVLNREIS